MLELKGKRAIVKVGQLPMNIDLVDLMVVEKVVAAPKISNNTKNNKNSPSKNNFFTKKDSNKYRELL